MSLCWSLSRGTLVPPPHPARPASRRGVAGWLLVLALTPTVGLAAPVVTLTEESVDVTALTPGGAVAVFGSSRRLDGWTPVRLSHAELATANGAGELSVTPDGGVPTQSVWLAVDLTTGEATVAWPVAAEPEERLFDLELGLPGPDLLEDEALGLELFLARPGVGAWTTVASDGGPTDVGPADDGRVRLNLATAARVGDTEPAYGAVQPGDVLFGIDMKTFSFFVVEVAS